MSGSKTRTEGSNIRSFQSQLVVKSYKPVKYIPKSEKIEREKNISDNLSKNEIILKREPRASVEASNQSKFK